MLRRELVFMSDERKGMRVLIALLDGVGIGELPDASFMVTKEVIL